MHQREIVVPLPETTINPKAYLKQFGFKPPVWVHGGTISTLAVPIFAIVLGITFHGRYRGIDVKMPDIVIAVASLGALLIGYWQWRKARHEISMDKYYDRLDIANRRQDGNQTRVHDMMKPSLPELSAEHIEILMYVYTELDNLEYVIEKYRLGYMTASQACRGLRTFQLRCWSPKFLCIARHRAYAGDYNRRTSRVVDRVSEEIEKLTTREFAPGRPGAGQVDAMGNPPAAMPLSQSAAQETSTGTEGSRRRASERSERRRAADAGHLSVVPNPASPEAPLASQTETAPPADPELPRPEKPELSGNAAGQNR